MGINGQCKNTTFFCFSFYISIIMVLRLQCIQSYDISHTQPYVGHEKITAAIGQNLTISGIGSLNLSTPHHTFFHIPNVYFVPKLSSNLISVGQLVDNGYSVHFSSFGCLIQDQQTGKVIKTATKHGRLFLLDIGYWLFTLRRLGHCSSIE